MSLKFVPFLLFILNSSVILAQVPERISYQATIRNSDNDVISNSRIALKIAILQNNINGNSVYEEVHNPVTSSNGVVGVEIGGGTPTQGDFSAIEWSKGPYFIQTSVDLNGGASYQLQAASQLISVPYALHAGTADRLAEGSGYITKAKVIPFENSRIADESDVGNIIECTSDATLTLIENFAKMEVGEIINLESHNGATLSVDTAPGVSLNYKENHTAFIESAIENVRFGLLRKIDANAYIISGQ